MRYTVLATVTALALASVAHAQMKEPSGPPPSAGPAAADEAKFKAADKNGNGALEGTETNALKADMPKIDTNKDGKITREEYLAASKSGLIK